MNVTGDDLAGVVDLFGALSREELGNALAELAFKRGEEYEPTAFAAEIDEALDSFHLVAVDADAVERADGEENASDDGEVPTTYLIAGPVAFPTGTEGAADLVHILDVPDRTVDRDVGGAAAIETYRKAVAEATADDDVDETHQLVEVSYEIEAWADVDLAEVRDDLTGE